MFTGTLIEELIATVDRAEASAREAGAAEIEPDIDLLLASINENSNYDPKLLGVA